PMQAPGQQTGMPQQQSGAPGAPMRPPLPQGGQPIQLPTNPETNLPYTQQQIDALPKMVPNIDLILKAISLLRNDKLRGLRIEVETDSTIQPNADQEKQDRIAFVEGVTKYLQVAGQLAMEMPDATPMLGKILQFAVRGFRVGRDPETTIDEF